MKRIRALLHEQIVLWDFTTRLSMGVAALLLVVMLAIAAFGPSSLRVPSGVGVAALIVMMQIIFMWGNRRMVTPFTEAQRHFLVGDFESATSLLEAVCASGKADANVLTLLGNTYRQMGKLHESEQVLLEALNISPSHHFPLYGFGRTLLAQGRYADAVEYIRRALQADAPAVVTFDLGEALYRLEDQEAAIQVLREAKNMPQESYRKLMNEYLLYALSVGVAPSEDAIAAGLRYWEETAARFAHTPYGQAVQNDVDQLRALR